MFAFNAESRHVSLSDHNMNVDLLFFKYSIQNYGQSVSEAKAMNTIKLGSDTNIF